MCECAAAARAAPDDLGVMPDVLPVARPRNVREGAVPVVAALGGEGRDHLLQREGAGRAHPQVLSSAAVLGLRGVPQPSLARERLRPSLGIAREAMVPRQARDAGALALPVMLDQHALREFIVRRGVLRGHAAGRSRSEQEPE